MRLLSVGTGIRRWLGGLRTQPVVLSSECPPGDCAARLVRVTAQRGLGVWYRDPQNYLYHRGDPRLLGTVDAGHVSVVHYPEGAGRNSFAPLLQGQLQPAADGGTTLTGTIGLHPAVGVGLPVMAVVWGAVVLVPFAVGIARLVTGHINGLLLTILSPLFWAVPALGIMVIGGGSLQRDIPKLIGEMCGILDASSTFPNPPAEPFAEG
jgi:hypothetical protein